MRPNICVLVGLLYPTLPFGNAFGERERLAPNEFSFGVREGYAYVPQPNLRLRQMHYFSLATLLRKSDRTLCEGIATRYN
jgi:hypothetical protein